MGKFTWWKTLVEIQCDRLQINFAPVTVQGEAILRIFHIKGDGVVGLHVVGVIGLLLCPVSKYQCAVESIAHIVAKSHLNLSDALIIVLFQRIGLSERNIC